MNKTDAITLEQLLSLKPAYWWRFFWGESLAFKMICGYLFVEYVRPQSIMPWLDFLPWASLFLLGSLVGLFIDPNKKWVSSPLNKWLILYYLSIWWSTLNAYYPDWSYKHMEFFYTWFIIYFLILNIVTTKERFLFFIAIFCVASFKISLSLAITWAKRGFSFTSWGLMGPPGYFQNSGELAIQMAVYWPIALGVAIACKPFVKPIVYRILLLMPFTAGMVILGASSRGGQLAMAVQLMLRFAKQIFRPKLLVSVGVIVFLGWAFLPDEQKARFESAGDDKTSQQRLLYWENGYEMMNEHPFTGVGYFNFPPYFMDYYPYDMLYDTPQLAHNIMVQVGADLGYVGLIIYCWLIAKTMLMSRQLARHELKKEQPDALAPVLQNMNTAYIGFLVAGQFVSVVYYPFMWIHLAFVAATYNIFSKSKNANAEQL